MHEQPNPMPAAKCENACTGCPPIATSFYMNSIQLAHLGAGHVGGAPTWALAHLGSGLILNFSPASDNMFSHYFHQGFKRDVAVMSSKAIMPLDVEQLAL